MSCPLKSSISSSNVKMKIPQVINKVPRLRLHSQFTIRWIAYYSKYISVHTKSETELP